MTYHKLWCHAKHDKIIGKMTRLHYIETKLTKEHLSKNRIKNWNVYQKHDRTFYHVRLTDMELIIGIQRTYLA